MMAAYQPQPGGMHPGMAAHAHPGQPMNPQMQQMGHPGVSGPGAPHVTQAGAMMGMQPGANGIGGPGSMGGQHPGAQMGGMPGQMGGQSMAGGTPNPHALSHMTPQQQMQQQQMIQMQANPQMALQQHQAQILAARRQQQLAQMQANGMGMQQAGMQGMTPQQMQQMQNNAGGIHPQSVQLPQHLQMQQMQLMRAQQQQQQQQAQNQQMQAHIAMQQANSQHSNQSSQQGASSQQGGQSQHPGQMRPQSRMANPNEQNQSAAQQNAQQAQQSQQQQQGQPNQQQGQQQMQQQQGQQQSMSQQQLQAMQQNQQRQRLQQQHMMQQNAMQQRMIQQQAQQQTGQQPLSNGAHILRVLLLGDQLSEFNSDNGKDVEKWYPFVERHWAPEGRFVHTFLYEEGNNPRSKRFEVPRATIPRYFQMYFDSGASSIRLHTEHAREQPLQQGRHQVSCSNATFAVIYPNGARLEMAGSVNVLFAPPDGNLIECMELQTTSSEEVVSRAEIERLLSNWSPTTSNKASPKMTKTKLPKAQKQMVSQFEGLTIDHFPRTPKGSFGVPTRVHQFLEIGETMNLMSDLMDYSQETKTRPEQAIEEWVERLQRNSQQNGVPQQGNPQINLPPNGVPVGNRTPSMQHMQIGNAQGGNQFSSPSVSNLNLPMQNGMAGMNGSPHIANNPGLAPNMNMSNSHTPSPHQSNMAAPQMVPQHSQQGTNSSAASANTSPNVNTKRRRSNVKMEGDEGGGDGSQQGQAANRVKPSPRMNKKSKPGGA